MSDAQTQAPQIPITELSRAQRRVLGVLVEKAITTPEAYPLTLKATTTGCNQKSNRDPIVNYEEDQVEEVLDELRALGLVAIVHTDTGRTARFRHYMRKRFTLTEPQLAILTELLLRGEQSLGELRTRASRMAPIESIEQLRVEVAGLMVQKFVRANGSLERRGVLVDHTLYTAHERRPMTVLAPESTSSWDDSGREEPRPRILTRRRGSRTRDRRGNPLRAALQRNSSSASVRLKPPARSCARRIDNCTRRCIRSRKISSVSPATSRIFAGRWVGEVSMLNGCFLCCSDFPRICPSLENPKFDPELHVISWDVESVPLLWIALFRPEDVRTALFQIQGREIRARAPFAEKERALSRLAYSVPVLNRVFAGWGPLDEHAALLQEALWGADGQYVTIELGEVAARYDESQFDSLFDSALEYLAIPSGYHSRTRSLFIELAEIEAESEHFPPARAYLDRIELTADDDWNFTRILGKSHRRPVPWEN